MRPLLGRAHGSERVAGRGRALGCRQASTDALKRAAFRSTAIPTERGRSYWKPRSITPSR